MHALGQQLDRRDARGGCEQRVLERAEAEHAVPRVAVGDTGLAEGVDVDREAAAGDEGTESRRNRGQALPTPISWPRSTRATSRYPST